MIYSFDNKKIRKSSFIAEEYFPIIIEFSDEELNNFFIEYNFRDSDMFELSVNPDNNALKRFSLTLCNHYFFEEAKLMVPDYEEGSLFVHGPAVTECDTFLVKVYSDGVQIEMSHDIPSKHFKCGQLIFSLTKNDTVVSVFVVGLSASEINFIKKELTE